MTFSLNVSYLDLANHSEITNMAKNMLFLPNYKAYILRLDYGEFI